MSPRSGCTADGRRLLAKAVVKDSFTTECVAVIRYFRITATHSVVKESLTTALAKSRHPSAVHPDRGLITAHLRSCRPDRDDSWPAGTSAAVVPRAPWALGTCLADARHFAPGAQPGA